MGAKRGSLSWWFARELRRFIVRIAEVILCIGLRRRVPIPANASGSRPHRPLSSFLVHLAPFQSWSRRMRCMGSVCVPDARMATAICIGGLFLTRHRFGGQSLATHTFPQPSELLPGSP